MVWESWGHRAEGLGDWPSVVWSGMKWSCTPSSGYGESFYADQTHAPRVVSPTGEEVRYVLEIQSHTNILRAHPLTPDEQAAMLFALRILTKGQEMV